ncbi:unnamed protein product [Pleuronectes platessa]|uniref:Uncharacterized protein n=1 Tax=Pleuronectes platessa TaxID=8262 RepID=A0A9N7VLV4_PLEPL|nr:unnamed protein product [Pleuronectes platessa]
MQMGQTGARTADLQVGGLPLYPSATAWVNPAKNLLLCSHISSSGLSVSFLLQGQAEKPWRPSLGHIHLFSQGQSVGLSVNWDLTYPSGMSQPAYQSVTLPFSLNSAEPVSGSEKHWEQPLGNFVLYKLSRCITVARAQCLPCSHHYGYWGSTQLAASVASTFLC